MTDHLTALARIRPYVPGDAAAPTYSDALIDHIGSLPKAAVNPPISPKPSLFKRALRLVWSDGEVM